MPEQNLNPDALSSNPALFKVASTHHFHGNECLCGFISPVSRQRTEHIMYETLSALPARPTSEPNPDAVEAGAKALFQRERKYHTPTKECPEPPDWEDLTETSLEHYQGMARVVLSALPAQPELQENSKPNQNLELQPDTVNSVEELEALPAKTVILDRIGDVSVIAETREFMCHDGESYTLDEVSADLPATVLYKPGE